MALDYILDIFSRVIEGMRVYPERMLKNIELTNGLVFSQRVLIALVESGLSRENSYEIVQRCAMQSWDENSDFRQLLRQEKQVREYLPGNSLESIFEFDYYKRHVDNSFMRLEMSKS